MEDFPINFTDLAVIVILLLSAVLALSRGFVREVLSIAGWIAAATLTYFTLPLVQEPVRKYFKNELGFSETIVADITAGSAIFIISLVIFTIITIIISRLVQKSDIGPLDRSLGFLFGLARGAFFACLAYLALVQFLEPKEHPKWITEAKTIRVIQTGANFLVRISPQDIRENLKSADSWQDRLIKRVNDVGDVVKGLEKTLTDVNKGYDKDERSGIKRLLPGGSNDDKDKN